MKKLKWHKAKTKKQLKKFYLSVIPKIRKVALKSGYAIGVHGSLERDLDLIAVAWVKKFVKPETLVDRICLEIIGVKYDKRIDKFTEKPNGRRAIIVPIGMYAFIDLSVIC